MAQFSGLVGVPSVGTLSITRGAHLEPCSPTHPRRSRRDVVIPELRGARARQERSQQWGCTSSAHPRSSVAAAEQCVVPSQGSCSTATAFPAHLNRPRRAGRFLQAMPVVIVASCPLRQRQRSAGIGLVAPGSSGVWGHLLPWAPSSLCHLPPLGTHSSSGAPAQRLPGMATGMAQP